MSNKKLPNDKSKMGIKRGQGEIDIIIDGENTIISSVCPEILDLLLSLDQNNKRLSKFKKWFSRV